MFTCETCGFERLSSGHVQSCDACANQLRKSTSLIRSLLAACGDSLAPELRLGVINFLGETVSKDDSRHAKLNTSLEHIEEAFEKLSK